MMGDEHHRPSSGRLYGQLIEQNTGLVVTAAEAPAALAQPSSRPRANGRSGTEADGGAGPAGDDDLKHSVLDEQPGKGLGVLAVVRIRVPSDHLLDGHSILDAHRRFRSCHRSDDVADAGCRPTLVVHVGTRGLGDLGGDGVENPFALLGERPQHSGGATYHRPRHVLG